METMFGFSMGSSSSSKWKVLFWENDFGLKKRSKVKNESLLTKKRERI